MVASPGGLAREGILREDSAPCDGPVVQSSKRRYVWRIRARLPRATARRASEFGLGGSREGGGKGKGLPEFCGSEFDFSTSAPLGKPQLRADADEELGMWCGDGRSFTGWIESAKGEKQPDTFRSSRWLRRSVEEPSNLDSEIRAGASEWRSAGAARARARARGEWRRGKTNTEAAPPPSKR